MWCCVVAFFCGIVIFCYFLFILFVVTFLLLPLVFGVFSYCLVTFWCLWVFSVASWLFGVSFVVTFAFVNPSGPPYVAAQEEFQVSKAQVGESVDKNVISYELMNPAFLVRVEKRKSTVI